MLTTGDDLVGALDDLQRTVRSIEARVAALEAQVADQQQTLRSHQPATVAGDATEVSDVARTAPIDGAGIAVLTGQGLLGLAGAYLLRALTEQGALPTEWGYTAGAAYACGWLTLAYVAGRAGASARSVAYGIVACSVAYPLTYEAATRIPLIGASGAALALGVFTGAALLVAAGVRLQAIAWVVVTFAVLTAAVLLPVTDRLMPTTLFVIGLGVETLWLGYVCDWFALRWPMAAVANLLVCWVVFGVPPGRGLETPTTAVVLGLLLAGAYLSSIVIRTLWRARDVLPFEVVQGFAALAVAIGGALMLQGDGSTVTVGTATLGFGAACYVASALAARQRGFAANFHFYSTLGLALVLTGVMLVFATPPAALVLSILAVVAATLAARHGLASLAVHAAAYAVVASLASNLLAASVAGLTGHLEGEWPHLGVTGIAVTAAAAVSLAILPRAATVQWSFMVRSARVLLLCIAVVGTATLAFAACLRLVGTAAGVDAGVLATVRTVIVGAVAVTLAWVARTDRLTGALGTAYAVLVLGGVKLVVEDFANSRPATLFIALAAYGGALIAVPRLVHRGRKESIWRTH